MGFDGEIWSVHSAAGPVGEIVIDDADFPWLSGRFVPGPAYDAVEPLFARELALLQRVLHDDGDQAVQEWEAAYDRVGRQVTLSSPDGPVAEFLLHIEGDRAWFRWSDEPFEEEAGHGDSNAVRDR
ncbi:hypothetical protein [Streptomyces sp. NPDC018693]|uniref:hypothetical protein n=1 Tax=unclassified Streptomyces TaxID=2593676 RepID=UPI0037B31E36